MRTWRNEEQIVEKQKKRLHTRLGVLQSSILPLKGKEKKNKLLQHGVFVFGHPSRYDPRQTGLTGLNFVEQTRRGADVVWTRHCACAKIRKGKKERKKSLTLALL